MPTASSISVASTMVPRTTSFQLSGRFWSMCNDRGACYVRPFIYRSPGDKVSHFVLPGVVVRIDKYGSPANGRSRTLTRRIHVSRSVNRVILVGNAGSDPDIQRTASGTMVAHVSLATNRRFRVNGEMQERTDWHRLTFWAAAAETVEQYVRRGNRLYVEGRIEYGSYDRDGQSVPTADVVVQEFVFLDGTGDEDHRTEAADEALDVEETAAV